jgi:hypothetical protein
MAKELLDKNNLVGYSKKILFCVILFYVLTVWDLLSFAGLMYTIIFGGIVMVFFLVYLLLLVIKFTKNNEKIFVDKASRILIVAGVLFLIYYAFIIWALVFS